MNHTDLQDRLMDVLLAEALGDQVPPDLVERILARAAQTAPQAPVRQRESMRRQETLPAPMQQPFVKRWAMPLAAAAALLLGLALGLYFFAATYPAPALAGDASVGGGGSLGRGVEVISGKMPARLTLGGYCNMDLAPHSRLKIDGAKRAEAVTLVDGQLTCEVNHGVGSFDIKTEIGTVHVVGTKFRTSVKDEIQMVHTYKGDQPMVVRKLVVAVLAGTVMVTGAWGQTPVTTGQTKVYTATATSQNISGKITQVAAGSVTLQTSTKTVPITLTDSTVIKVNGTVTTASYLVTGMRAYALTTDGVTATELLAYTPPVTTPPTTPPTTTSPNNFSGKITQIGTAQLTLQNSTKTVNVTLTAGTIFKLDKQPSTLAALHTGLYAYAITSDGATATQILAYTPKPSPTPPPTPAPNTNNFSGKITQIGADQLTLQTSSKTIPITLTASTVIKVNKQISTLAALQTGMHAYAITTDGVTATEIRAYLPNATTSTPATTTAKPATTTPSSPSTTKTTTTTSNKVFGVLTAGGNGTVTVTYNGKSTTVAFNDQTVVKISNNIVPITDLKMGMHAAITLGADGKTAVSIMAYMPTTTTR